MIKRKRKENSVIATKRDMEKPKENEKKKKSKMKKMEKKKNE